MSETLRRMDRVIAGCSSITEDRVRVLLRDYGFRLLKEGDDRWVVLRQADDYSYSGPVWTCRSPLDAAERMCPIVYDPEYTARLEKIARPLD
jgi:hypothetical protein